MHHIDENKDNNTIENLELLSRKRHQQLHGKQKYALDPDKVLESLEKARVKAVEWHKSDKGRQWHKEHRENIKDVIMLKNKVRECAYCGKIVMSHLYGKNVYCDRACEFSYIQEQGKITGKEYTCENCGKVFKWHKEKKSCSKECHKATAKKNRPKYEYTCEECGKEFIRDRKIKRVYCSEKCSKKSLYSKKEYDTKACEICGAEFKPTKSTDKYCGDACRKIKDSRRDRSRGKANI